jgi:hypothetical protein
MPGDGSSALISYQSEGREATARLELVGGEGFGRTILVQIVNKPVEKIIAGIGFPAIFSNSAASNGGTIQAGGIRAFCAIVPNLFARTGLFPVS